MNKLVLIIIFAVLLISSCGKEDNTQESLLKQYQKNASENTVQIQEKKVNQSPNQVTKKLCNDNESYISGICCQDSDKNNICDNKESKCGDGTCSKAENKCTCPLDCGECSENSQGCYEYQCINDQCIKDEKTPCCGNNICESGEECTTCSQDCCQFTEEDNSLEDFIAIANNMKPVLGRKAPATDVIAISKILEMLQKSNVRLGQYSFADEHTEFEDYKQGSKIKNKYLIVGSPCDNEATAAIYHYEIQKQGKCEIFKSGSGIIEMIKTGDYTYSFSVIISGNTNTDVLKAANFLNDFDSNKNKLEGKTRYEVN